MFGIFTPYDDARPIAHIGRVPVTLTLILAAVQILSLVAGVIFLRSGLMTALIFDSERFFAGQAWRAFTYALANDVRTVSPPFFLIGLVFFLMFGGMVEARLGAARFGLLYGLLWLFLPLVLVIGVPFFGHGSLAGSSLINLGCFIAFATLFPHLPVLFSLTAKWVASGYVAILALQMVAYSAWGQVWALAGLCVVSTLLARKLDAPSELATLSEGGFLTALKNIFASSRSPKLQALPPPDDPERVVDTLLDKISQRGIGSLTATERRQLENARIALIRRDENK